MQQLIDVWTKLDTRRRVIVALATMAMFAAVLFMARMAGTPSMSLLYAGLEAGAAGEVVSALEARGVAYEVRGGSILVESGRRDELRMTLASEGLPTNNSKGYELLDGLSGFGTTSQMFDAAYWRAKEGELARTIVASPQISAARVHIANSGNNPFQRDVKPTASVSVTTGPEGVTAAHAKSLKFLVASAVAGLSPDDVTVIDGQGNLIGAGDEVPANAADDRADTLRQKVQRLLEARVGYGNAVVEVAVDTVQESELVRERRIDPESRVAISTETEERNDTAQDQGGGDVTVASNLPDGDAGAGDSSQSSTNETRERVNYEISETEREITRGPGAVKRLTVAVLVNGTLETAEDGTETFAPRSEEELAALEELVSSAVGFDADRGDVITIKTMQFEPMAVSGTAVAGGGLSNLNIDIMSLIQMAVLAVVALILGLFVLKPLLAGGAGASAGALPAPAGGEDDLGLPDFSGGMQALNGEIDNSDYDIGNLPVISGGMGGLPTFGDEDDIPTDPVERLRNMIGERQEETVEILRSWLEGEEERA